MSISYFDMVIQGELLHSFNPMFEKDYVAQHPPTIGTITTRYNNSKTFTHFPPDIEYVIYTDKGWVPCNGQILEKSEYPLLYKALQDINYSYGTFENVMATEFCVLCKLPVIDDYICPLCAKEEKLMENGFVQLPNLSGRFNF